MLPPDVAARRLRYPGMRVLTREERIAAAKDAGTSSNCCDTSFVLLNSAMLFRCVAIALEFDMNNRSSSLGAAAAAAAIKALKPETDKALARNSYHGPSIAHKTAMAAAAAAANNRKVHFVLFFVFVFVFCFFAQNKTWNRCRVTASRALLASRFLSRRWLKTAKSFFDVQVRARRHRLLRHSNKRRAAQESVDLKGTITMR